MRENSAFKPSGSRRTDLIRLQPRVSVTALQAAEKAGRTITEVPSAAEAEPIYNHLRTG